MGNGNALVGRLLLSALDSKVELWNYSPVLSLINENGSIKGAVIQNNGIPIRVLARKGVVIASGGFGANPRYVNKYYQNPESHVNSNPVEIVGDGLEMAQEVGSTMSKSNKDNAVWAPTSTWKFKDGTFRRYPHFGPDRGKPGVIIVDSNGQRFYNEAAPYVPFVNAMKSKNIHRAYMIADKTARFRYGMGFALPFPYPDLNFTKDGYLISAPTISELAKKLSIDPKVLEKTVSQYNEHARNGQDPVFHKGENDYDPSQGDIDHKPNPNVAPLENGPFYAIEMRPGDVNSVVGLVTNENAQVLDKSGNVIGGLYSAGADNGNLFHGIYFGGGSGIGPGMTFGYRAALHLAGKHQQL